MWFSRASILSPYTTAINNVVGVDPEPEFSHDALLLQRDRTEGRDISDAALYDSRNVFTIGHKPARVDEKNT